jgi:CheY-like chemotaxis protein
MTAAAATDWVQFFLAPVWTGLVLVVALGAIWLARRPLRRVAADLDVSRLSLFGIDLEWIADQRAEAYREQGVDVPTRRQLQPVAHLGNRLAPLVAGRRVLWVDDNPSWIQSEARALRKLGVDVDTAVTTEEALAAIGKNPARFDLVISDWTRNGRDAGPDLLQKLNQLDTPRLSVVFYTARTPPARRAEAAELGAVALTALPDELLKYVLVELATQE